VPRRSAAAVVALLFVLAGCAVSVPGTPFPESIERKGPQGPVPPGLARFYGQEIVWGACEPYAVSAEARDVFVAPDIECARVEVPLDYAAPEARVITLGLLRRQAESPRHRIGSLLINPGGPGYSGMTAAVMISDELRESELAQRFDLVGFDPRGVGASEPAVVCMTDAERDADRLDLDLDTSPEGVARVEAEERALADKCAQRVGTDVLAHLGTREVAQDLDVLRSALGDAKLTYLGFSYGTRIGTAYAERFPTNVRAMILDGALAPEQDQLAQATENARGFRDAFDAFAAWCVVQRECPLGTDQDLAERRLDELAEPLKDKPLDVGDRKLSYRDVGTVVLQSLYSDQLWEPLTEGLSELADGDGDVLLELADLFLGRDPDGTYPATEDAFMAVRCVDDPPITDRAVLAEHAAKIKQEFGSPFDDEPVIALDACAFWPVPHTSQPHRPEVKGLPAVLVISTTGDPATPYQAGVDLAGALNARLLTFEGNQHTVFGQGEDCVDRVGTRYLVDLELPRDDNTRC
jgi:pimeloyl-ACP methyl ester carboxylesterase